MTSCQMEFSISRVEKIVSKNFIDAIHALQNGKVVLLLDAHDRENEGDLIVAGEKITTETMNFLIQEGSGVVCLAMYKHRLDELGLPLMVAANTNFFNTAFTVSIEARLGVTTGVSARDRAHTIKVAMADEALSSDLARPGHVFPLAAHVNGVFDRMGHTEGSVDLLRIAGLKPGAVLCELMDKDGSMTSGEARINFANSHGIPVVSVEEIFLYRLQTETIFTKTKKEISSVFGALLWFTFSFDCGLDFHIFTTPTQKNHPIRMTCTRLENLEKRFFAQILERNSDDGLLHALGQLGEDKLDAVISYTGQGPLSTKAENTFFKTALLCRVLQDLDMHQLAKENLDGEIVRLANYFSINII